MLSSHCEKTKRRAGVFFLGAAAALFALATPASADILEELSELRLGCETGEGAACLALARRYEEKTDLWGAPVRGEGVRRDDATAERYFRKACDLGDESGCRKIGRRQRDDNGRAVGGIRTLRN